MTWMRAFRSFEDFPRDLRIAARTLSHQASFAVAVILTVGLGVGATTAIFTVVYGVLLRPLPYRDADALAVIQAVPDTSAGIPATLRRFGAPE
ncbi:MAG: hypothetical protein ACRD26_21015, partial [Vicinamibacterales bacterium]